LKYTFAEYIIKVFCRVTISTKSWFPVLIRNIPTGSLGVFLERVRFSLGFSM
jgi:hypothetical protein